MLALLLLTFVASCYCRFEYAGRYRVRVHARLHRYDLARMVIETIAPPAPAAASAAVAGVVAVLPVACVRCVVVLFLIAFVVFQSLLEFQRFFY